MHATKQFLLVFPLLLILLNGCTSEDKKNKEQLGDLNFIVTGNAVAQPFFKKGLLLLHSFEYDDAAENFLKARQLDTTFVMAYWGEAMTCNHPLWRFQNKSKADSILFRLAIRPEERMTKATTPVERDFIAAVSILYGEGTKEVRDQRYADFMGELYKKYPDNLEVASFYSLALLGSVEVGRDTKVYEHAAEVAKGVLASNPNHPGALHYLIHSYDDPDHAALALNAADAYAKVAPAAAHALHMPSHIYLALGLWDKVVSSNIAAWAASEQRKELKKLNNDALGYHAFHWLMYGYLELGNKEEAKKMVEQMKKYCDSLPSARAREHMLLLKSTYLVESGDWQSTVPDIEVKQDDLNISVHAMNYFVNGMKAYYSNDGASILLNNTRLKNEIAEANMKAVDETGHSCGSSNSNAPNLLDVQYAEVMQMELEALASWLKKDTSVTQQWFTKATTLENSISYSYGPPAVVKPSNELYGEWLLQINQPAPARQQFEIALKAAPNRTISIKGLASANTLINASKPLAHKL